MRILILGSMICPILALSGSFFRNIAFDNERSFDLFTLYDSAIMFLMLLFGPMVLAIVAISLITREYNEQTWKTIFVVPVSRIRVLIGKFLILFLLVILFMVFSWAETFILAVLCSFLFEVSDITWMSGLFFFIQMIKGGILLYPVITPFLYLALRTKGGLVPFSMLAGIILVNVVLSNTSFAKIDPWLLPYHLLYLSRYEKINQGNDFLFIGIGITGILFIGSFLGSILRIYREDIY